jgi:hypothetical protein
MKLEEILEARQVFKHPSGKVETLDDYSRKLFKRGNKAGHRLRDLAKKTGKKNES